MSEAWIIDACRTPRGIGKVGKGALAELHPQQLGATVLKALAERLANGPTRALGLMRQGLARAMEQTYEQALASEALHQALAADSADAQEGATAFLERRKPVFKGI